MKKIVVIVGARPQFIKAFPVSQAIKDHNKLNKNNIIKEVIVHTGQHYDYNMSGVFFKELGIRKPDYFLGVGSGGHGKQTGEMLSKIEEVLLKEKPDIVLIFGDTNSTVAGALAASKLHITVAHVEAGLRSDNMLMPEEINRILTDRISNFLFCPTKTAVENLKEEGYKKFNCKIIKTGDVMYDAAMHFSKSEKKPNFDIPDKFVLATIHRAENTDNKKILRGLFSALNDISKSVEIILPLHPRTFNVIKSMKLKFSKSINIVQPVGYLEILYMIKRAKLIMTDSGGLQKEAYFMKKRCITLRDETEWLETLDNGWNYVVGHDKNKIIDVFKKIFYAKSISQKRLFGNGHASERIVEILAKD